MYIMHLSGVSFSLSLGSLLVEPQGWRDVSMFCSVSGQVERSHTQSHDQVHPHICSQILYTAFYLNSFFIRKSLWRLIIMKYMLNIFYSHFLQWISRTFRRLCENPRWPHVGSLVQPSAHFLFLCCSIELRPSSYHLLLLSHDIIFSECLLFYHQADHLLRTRFLTYVINSFFIVFA